MEHSTPENMETPSYQTQIKPKRLFDKIDNHKVVDPHIDQIRTEGMNGEILLLTTLIITAVKVQAVIEVFIKGKDYISIFCFTETKVAA